jgi:microsomal dipeptidase-like Zn-dependent dipeptidase
METPFIDLHLHPAIKPMGKSFNENPGVNNLNKNKPDSIWNYDPPTLLDKIINIAATLTKFRQSDFTSLAKGGAQVVLVSMCALEKGFVMTKLGTAFPGDVLNDLVIGTGLKRINHVQRMTSYFPDLEMEYQFYRQLDGKKFKVDGNWHRYKLVSNFQEIDLQPNAPVRTIYVILTIEGGHAFDCGLGIINKKANPEQVLAHVDKVKQWENRLFFMGLTHHFHNELVGHAKSLSGMVAKICDQTEGMNEGFTDLGWKVLRKLLDNTNGRRVLIDLKHMSVKARNQYYEFLKNEHPNDNIPLLVSHGAVTGQKSHINLTDGGFLNAGKFQALDINFYDDEIVRIAQSGGIFGIQFDERRLGSEQEVKDSGKNLNRRKMLFKKSKLIWNQIQHIAEVLDRQNLPAWDVACIGTDNDGMVNPLNGFWTAEEMPMLDSYLEKHAFNFLSSPDSRNLKPFNKLTADEIVERFMRGNAWEFLKKNF